MNDRLKRALQGDLSEYRSIPFWSWNNFLDEKVLCAQIAEMHSAGIGGFVLHARTGLKEEYLGEKWFSCIEACLQKAKELGMEVWIYDENGWPSGFVGGKLLENETFHARYLTYEAGRFDAAAFAVFVRQGGGFARVNEERQGVSEYHNVYLRVSPANTDILDPQVTDAFLAQTHEKYYARFKDSFGKELCGFFTDEPQYYRWAVPYTPVAEREFAARGEDIRDGLIWLFKHGEDGYLFRQKYYETLNRLYVQNFYKKLYDWCEGHGCRLTGHSVEESSLSGQMWGCAGVMPSYAYEHVPGIDWLGRECGDELAPRQVCSVAEQLGRKLVLTETFGCAGYDVTPKELKSLAEYQYFNGVNKMCQHLYPYSMAGGGKTDHPPVFSPQANWFEGFRTFNEYFARLGYIVVETRDVCDVGIIHPQRDVWLDYIRSEDRASVRETEEAFADLLMKLRKRGVTYQFIDETILAEYGSVEQGELRVGSCKYGTVIVPQMRTLASHTYALLKKFTGRLCILGKVGYIGGKAADIALRSDISLDEILKSSRFGFSCEDGNCVLTARRGDIGEFVFIKNLSRTEESLATLAGAAEHYSALDLETLQEYPLADDAIRLGGAESILLRRCKPHRKKIASVRVSEDVTDQFRVTDITENYLILDHAQLARGEGPFGERLPLPGHFEQLLREDYRGKIRVRQTFVLRDKVPLSLCMERADFDSVTVNGHPVRFGQSDFDVNFMQTSPDAYLREGENELVYELYFWQHEGVRFALFDPSATESLRNCLYYDTALEPAYLKGKFVLGKDLSIQRRETLPPIAENLSAVGYPFFKGTLTLEGEIAHFGNEKVLLQLEGRFLMAEVYANGKKSGLVLDTKKDIAPILRRGTNRLKIVLRSGLRNLFGPSHFKGEEPAGVSPYHFNFRGFWENGTPADYTDEYRSVPFGLRAVKVIRA